MLSELFHAVLCMTLVHNGMRMFSLCLVRVGLVFGVFLKVWLVCLCVFVGKGLVYIFVCFCIHLDYLGFMLLVLLGLVFSVLSREIGWEERL